PVLLAAPTPVSARLFTGDVALLEERHREATLREVIGGRRAEDAAADDDDVGLGRETLIAVNALDVGRHVPMNLGCQECGRKVPISPSSHRALERMCRNHPGLRKMFGFLAA